MASEGDITDSFDDDDLKNSIEAGKSGPWNDESATFEDPRLTKVTQELTAHKTTDYQERRMRELQQQAARKEAAEHQPATATGVSNESQWGEATSSEWDDDGAPNMDEWREPEPAAAVPTPAPEPAKPRVTGTVAQPTPEPASTEETGVAWWLWTIIALAAAGLAYVLLT